MFPACRERKRPAHAGGNPVRQLVGCDCIHCGERITNELESRFCSRCFSPVHVRCAQPGAGDRCPICGADVPLPPLPPPPPPPAAGADSSDRPTARSKSTILMPLKWGAIASVIGLGVGVMNMVSGT